MAGARPFVTDTVPLNTMIMNAAVPSAVVIAVLAIQYDRDPELAAEGAKSGGDTKDEAFMQTLCSVG